MLLQVFKLLLVLRYERYLIISDPLIFRKLFEQVLDEVHDAQGTDLFRRQLNQQETKLVLERIHVTTLHKDLLLLSNGKLNSLHPPNDVPMRRSKLIGATNLDQIVQTLLVFAMRQLETELLELQLPLEEVHGVLLIRIANTVHGQYKLV